MTFTLSSTLGLISKRSVQNYSFQKKKNRFHKSKVYFEHKTLRDSHTKQNFTKICKTERAHI